jgi:alpha-tubulin suppressor-like RCC1 family protein
VYTARIVAGLVALALVSCAVFLGLEDHEPYPGSDAPDASDASSEDGCGDTTSDTNNCGACGVRCGSGYVCAAGVCGNRVDAVGAGSHACALLHAGDVWCWGPNTLGQLGVRAPNCTTCPAPARVGGVSGAVELSVGLNTTCVRTQDGSVLCWGEAGSGQLGPDAGVTPCADNTPCAPTPQKIPLPRAAKQIATGSSYACALLDDGSAYCWGDDTYGELGNGAPGPARETPAKVIITNDVAEIAAGRGRTTTCATKTDGTIWCWGVNFRGLLGHAGVGDPQCNQPTGGAIACNATPTPIASFSGFSQPTVSQIGCANGGSKGIYCWGFNGNGQLGLGTIDSVEHPTPAPIVVASPVRLAPGVNHACGLDENGQVSCWGYNFWGTAGDGTTNGPAACEGGQLYCQPKASHVLGLPKIVDLSSGLEISVALGVDGTVWAWGYNQDGRIGHEPGQADGGANDVSCYVPGVGGGPCSPSPARVFGLP